MRPPLRLSHALPVLSLLLALAGCGGGGASGSSSSRATTVAPPTTSAAPRGPGSTPGRTAPGATVAPAATGAPVAPVVTHTKGDLLSPLDARTGVLRDALGRQHLLRGVNYAGRAKWPPFTGWARRADVDAIQALGMDHVRLLVTWHAIEPRDGVFDDAYLAEVATIISWFEASGIRVVVDMHQDQFALRFGGDGFPEWMILDPDPFPFLPDIVASFPFNYVNPKVVANFDAFYLDPTRRARLGKAWSHAVSKLKGSKAVMGYDLLNEPFFGFRSPIDFEANILQPLNDELIAAVRSQDPDRIVFFEPQLEAGLFVSTGLKHPSDPNVVYSPHWYDPGVDLRAAVGLHPAYDGDASRTAAALDKLDGHGRMFGTPVWIGEYGIVRTQTGAEAYLDDHNRLFDERLMSACCWTIDTATSSTYSCLDTNIQPFPIADQWAHPHPRAVAGTLERTSYDPSTKTLEVRWREGKLGPGAPTVVELPLRLFASGVQLDVTLTDAPGTWRFERESATGRLYVWADEGASVHTLTVRPH